MTGGHYPPPMTSATTSLADGHGKMGLCYVLSRGTSGPGIWVRSQSSGVRGGVGCGFSEWVAALTRLSRPVLVMGRGCVVGCDDEAVDSNGGDAHEQEL